MKATMTFLSCLLCIQLFACCSKVSTAGNSYDCSTITDSMRIRITIGKNTFIASLYNNAAAKAFMSGLPMTIDMIELNGNEKYFDLSNHLPSNPSNPRNIQAGDLMLYGSNTLVLFYKSFSTSYSYTPMARIHDASRLPAALGSGNVKVSFVLVSR